MGPLQTFIDIDARNEEEPEPFRTILASLLTSTSRSIHFIANLLQFFANEPSDGVPADFDFVVAIVTRLVALVDVIADV